MGQGNHPDHPPVDGGYTGLTNKTQPKVIISYRHSDAYVILSTGTTALSVPVEDVMWIVDYHKHYRKN